MCWTPWRDVVWYNCSMSIALQMYKSLSNMRNIVNHIRNVDTSHVWSACFAMLCLIFCYEDPCSSVVGSCVAGLCVCVWCPWGSPTQPYTLRLRVDCFMYCFILHHLLFNVLCCAVPCCVVLVLCCVAVVLCCAVLCCVVLCCVVLCCHVVFVLCCRSAYPVLPSTPSLRSTTRRGRGPWRSWTRSCSRQRRTVCLRGGDMTRHDVKGGGGR